MINDLIIKPSSLAGRGVFAQRNFAKDEIIERCPVIVLNEKDTKQIDPTDLYNYYFSWGDDLKSGAIALGCGSIYNHSYNPNAAYKKDIEHDEIIFLSIRDIKAGDEIVVNYNGQPDDHSPLWFTPA